MPLSSDFPVVTPRKPIAKPKRWLNDRRTYIGGTDIAAIMGVHPYATPLTVYEQKLGLAST
jgi:predicted phage-related endonuclease